MIESLFKHRVETTHRYVGPELTMNENAMCKLTPTGSAPGTFKPNLTNDEPLGFLAVL